MKRFRDRRKEREGERVRAIDISGRVPPHNEQAEAGVLSAILTDGKGLDDILDLLPSGEAFYSDAHQRIYDACVEVHTGGQPVDLTTVSNLLKDRDRLKAIGGVSYLVKIVDATPWTGHVRAHAKIVREKWRVRQLIERCQVTAAEAFGDYGDAQEFIDGHERAVFEIAHVRDQQTEPAPIGTIMRDVVQVVQRAHDGPGAITGASSGLQAIDERTTGYHPGELIFVAARPGMGKTSYLLGVAQHLAELPQARDEQGTLKRDEKGVALQPGYVVVIFSLEMPRDQLAARLACMSAGLSFADARKGRLGRDYGLFVQHAEHIARLPIVIDDTAAIGLFEMRAKLRRIVRQYPERKLITMLDYVQLMSWLPGIESREEGVSENSKGLKALAKEFATPVIAIAQLNRGPESRPDKRPQLSDLRESGSLEQDADMVQLIYRPEYYAKKGEVPERIVGLAEIDTAKQRNGPAGIDEIAFRGRSMRFENATDNDLDRWEIQREDQPRQQPKMFAPGSRLPGASANEN